MDKIQKILKALVLFFGLLLLVIIGWRVKLSSQQNKTREALNQIQDYGTVPEFAFTSQSNKPFGSKDLKGSTYVCDFIFTRCMGPCPMITSQMASLQHEFTSPKLKFVSFSIDPEHDTAEVLEKYAKPYMADFSRWTFLTGEKQKIYELIRNNFKLAVEQASPNSKKIGDEADFIHSVYFVLVDANGKIKGYFNALDQAQIAKLKEELKKIS